MRKRQLQQTKVSTKITIAVLCVFVAFAAVFLAMRNMAYFTITEVSITTTPEVVANKNITDITDPLCGRNIFSVTTSAIKSQLSKLAFVTDVQVSKSYPGRIEVRLTLDDFLSRAWCENGANSRYFLCMEGLVEVDKETWNMYAHIPAVQLNPSYANMIASWGADAGFLQMETLVRSLAHENLITSLKYDNNDSESFGCLILGLDRIGCRLEVREPVTPQRLAEALSVIGSMPKGSESVVTCILDGSSLFTW